VPKLILLALFLVLAVPAAASTAASEGVSGWTVSWAGKASVVDGELLLEPTGIADTDDTSEPSHTYSALALSNATHGVDVEIEATMRTVKQTRVDDPPNPWECAWLMWALTDLSHYYYFVLKPNGWQLSKKQGGPLGGWAPELFLATGTSPQYPIGPAHRLRVVQTGSDIRVWANGEKILDYRDASPLLSGGRVGLYGEDAVVGFREVTIGAGATVESASKPRKGKKPTR
jgi:hypothetical protein